METECIDALRQVGFNPDHAQQLLHTYGPRMIRETCSAYASNVNNGAIIKNPAGWIRAVLKNGGAQPATAMAAPGNRLDQPYEGERP